MVLPNAMQIESRWVLLPGDHPARARRLAWIADVESR